MGSINTGTGRATAVQGSNEKATGKEGAGPTAWGAWGYCTHYLAYCTHRYDGNTCIYTAVPCVLCGSKYSVLPVGKQDTYMCTDNTDDVGIK